MLRRENLEDLAALPLFEAAKKDEPHVAEKECIAERPARAQAHDELEALGDREPLANLGGQLGTPHQLLEVIALASGALQEHLERLARHGLPDVEDLGVRLSAAGPDIDREWIPELVISGAGHRAPKGLGHLLGDLR